MPAPPRLLARVLFNALAALSLLLSVAACVMWARSYRVREEASLAWRGVLLHVGSGGGSLHVQTARTWPGRPGAQWVRLAPAPSYGPRTILGERVTHGADALDWAPPVRPLTHNSGSMIVDTTSGSAHWMRHDYRRVPYACLAGAFALILTLRCAAIVARRWRRRRRVVAGRCPACGYDLAGNESGVCPECGAGIRAAAAASTNAAAR